MSGGRVTRLAVLAVVVVLALDLAIFRHPTILFDIAFVLTCVGAALAVRPRDFFRIGVLPPLLLLGLMLLIALIHRGWIARDGDGLLQAVVSGLAHRASGLLTAYLLTLAVLAIRQRVRARHLTLALEREADVQTNRQGSPAPTLSTTGEPSERSTTVVGSEPHSPESITASSH